MYEYEAIYIVSEKFKFIMKYFYFPTSHQAKVKMNRRMIICNSLNCLLFLIFLFNTIYLSIYFLLVFVVYKILEILKLQTSCVTNILKLYIKKIAQNEY